MKIFSFFRINVANGTAFEEFSTIAKIEFDKIVSQSTVF